MRERQSFASTQQNWNSTTDSSPCIPHLHTVSLIVVLIVWVPFDHRLSAEKHRKWACWAVAVVVGAVVLGGAVTQFLLCVLALIGWGVSLQCDNGNMMITITINAFKRNVHFCWLNEHVRKKASVYRPIIKSKYTHTIQAQTRGNLVSYSRGKDQAGCLTCRLTVTRKEFQQYVPITFFSTVAL